jgi:hypothetical protein
VPDVREQYDAYREAVQREQYRFRSGQKATLELAEVDDHFEELTSGDLLDDVEASRASATMEEAAEAWRRLSVAIRGTVVERRTRQLSRELREREAAQRIRIGGGERTLYAWQAHLGSEADTERRRQIQEGLVRAWADLNPLREELFIRRGELLGRPEPATPRAWAEEQHPGLDYDAWRGYADEILEKTESVYRDALTSALRGIGVDPGQAHSGDSAHAFRMQSFDALFPGERIEQALDFTTRGLGIRLRDVPGVEIDGEVRPGKHPRASCIPARLPGEVYVLFYPHGGELDYESVFHEAGHALHFAFTSSDLPVERRRILDPALTEAWAFLMHYRLADPAWIEESPAAERAANLLPAIRLRKLFLLRRYSAKLRFELELTSVEPGESPVGYADLYSDELTRATGVHYRPAGYLIDTDPDLYCADYLRAWCLEAKLTEYLRERFGRRFWKERRAGDLLKELWNTGATYTADGIAQELGLGPIDPECLIDDCLQP